MLAVSLVLAVIVAAFIGFISWVLNLLNQVPHLPGFEQGEPRTVMGRGQRTSGEASASPHHPSVESPAGSTGKEW